MGRDRRYEWLLNDLCVRLSWCGSIKDGKALRVDDFIPAQGLVTAEQFAEWVILADSCDPKSREARQRDWIGQISEMFVNHMKAEAVDATELKR